jgi:hypothetical protein
MNPQLKVTAMTDTSFIPSSALGPNVNLDDSETMGVSLSAASRAELMQRLSRREDELGVLAGDAKRKDEQPYVLLF